MNYYPHHISDFNNATRHLTRLEKSIYRDLIELYYETEMPLQCDRIALARKILVRGDDEIAAMDAVLAEFFTLEGDLYHHSRCDDELAKIYEKSDKARASAEKRWAKKGAKTTKNANAMRTHSDGNANGMLPSTHNPVTTTTTRPTVDDVAAYVQTRVIKINPHKFVDYYTANGWKVGRNSMKDWKAAVRTWEKSENANTQNPVNRITDSRKLSGAERTRIARAEAYARLSAAESPDLECVGANQVGISSIVRELGS